MKLAILSSLSSPTHDKLTSVDPLSEVSSHLSPSAASKHCEGLFMPNTSHLYLQCLAYCLLTVQYL